MITGIKNSVVDQDNFDADPDNNDADPDPTSKKTGYGSDL
jgi:hypothetical protein